MSKEEHGHIWKDRDGIADPKHNRQELMQAMKTGDMGRVLSALVRHPEARMTALDLPQIESPEWDERLDNDPEAFGPKLAYETVAMLDSAQSYQTARGIAAGAASRECPTYGDMR